MNNQIDVNKMYKKSEDVVAREFHGEFIIIPITSGIGDLEDELFTLNEFGKAIWDRLDGEKNVKKLAENLSQEYEASPGEIEKDTVGFMYELFKRGIIVEA
ncbi:MAG: PqqD family protein [Candidatus Eremiobacterota bacterium]